MGSVLKFQRPRRSSRSGGKLYAGLIWVALLGAGASLYAYRIASGPTLTAGDPHAAYFAICDSGPRITCVVDGDTLWFERTKIRIADLDAPEVSQPACSREYDLAQKATQRLIGWMNEGPFSLTAVERDKDRYGRTLRIVSRSGVSVADVLISEGLAHRWDGTKQNWCD